MQFPAQIFTFLIKNALVLILPRREKGTDYLFKLIFLGLFLFCRNTCALAMESTCLTCRLKLGLHRVLRAGIQPPKTYAENHTSLLSTESPEYRTPREFTGNSQSVRGAKTPPLNVFEVFMPVGFSSYILQRKKKIKSNPVPNFLVL